MTALVVHRVHAEAKLPARGSSGAAGYDLASVEHAVVPARGRAMVATGLCITVPQGTYGRIAPRSGLTWKSALDVGAGVIDSDYTGEVKVILFNHSDVDVSLARGDRVAQLILEQCATPEVVEAQLAPTARGDGAFGSTDRIAQLTLPTPLI